jgi:hypothetical protein
MMFVPTEALPPLVSTHRLLITTSTLTINNITTNLHQRHHNPRPRRLTLP